MCHHREFATRSGLIRSFVWDARHQLVIIWQTFALRTMKLPGCRVAWVVHCSLTWWCDRAYIPYWQWGKLSRTTDRSTVERHSRCDLPGEREIDNQECYVRRWVGSGRIANVYSKQLQTSFYEYHEQYMVQCVRDNLRDINRILKFYDGFAE